MNTYFEKNSVFNSDSGTFKRKTQVGATVDSGIRRSLENILYIIISALSSVASSTVNRILRAVGVAGALIGFVGVIGAMERGTLGLASGMFVGALLVGIEYLCLRPRHKTED